MSGHRGRPEFEGRRRGENARADHRAAWLARHDQGRQRLGVHLEGDGPLGLREWRGAGFLATGEVDRQRQGRILQRPATGGMPECALVLVARRRQAQNRGVAEVL